MLHVGHIRLLKFARTLGDSVTVSIASDEHIQDWKGRAPANPQEYRREALEALSFVDRVVITEGLGVDATCRMLGIMRPDIYVKGAEYRGRLDAREVDAVERNGGQIVFFQEFDKGRCSTSAIRMKHPLFRAGHGRYDNPEHTALASKAAQLAKRILAQWTKMRRVK